MLKVAASQAVLSNLKMEGGVGVLALSPQGLTREFPAMQDIDSLQGS